MTNSKGYTERVIEPISGWTHLFFTLCCYAAAITAIVIGSANDKGLLLVPGILYMIFGWIMLLGLRIVKPNEALVLTLFGKYYGTIKKEGFYKVNPFCSANNPMVSFEFQEATDQTESSTTSSQTFSKAISLKAQVFANNKQKINDERGNPIEVGIVVTWRVRDTAKAVFDVDCYPKFVEIQADSAIRDVVRCYPYDDYEGHTVSLRGESAEISNRIEEELQKRVTIAGIEVLDARITHLAYAPEIASAMLQRQQAEAVIEARQKIVDGAVGMVEMALHKLSENNVVELDDERKAQMVSNLLVVLCGNKDAQPIVNSGTIY